MQAANSACSMLQLSKDESIGMLQNKVSTLKMMEV